MRVRGINLILQLARKHIAATQPSSTGVVFSRFKRSSSTTCLRLLMITKSSVRLEQARMDAARKWRDVEMARYGKLPCLIPASALLSLNSIQLVLTCSCFEDLCVEGVGVR